MMIICQLGYCLWKKPADKKPSDKQPQTYPSIKEFIQKEFPSQKKFL